MTIRSTRLLLVTLATIGVVACGAKDAAPSGAADVPDAQDTGDAPASRVCSLLTAEQVASVLPGHDGGRDRDTSEASLLKDVSLEHCQYTFVKELDLRFLDVFVWTATSDAGVDSLPTQLRHCPDDDCRRLDMGDLSFAATWNDSPHVVVNKGRQVLEISLNGEGATANSDALAELTRSAAAKLWP
jgi:hypothetical protein